MRNKKTLAEVSANAQPEAQRAPEKHIDSPVIYGDRVETSNPYHLGYIDSSEIIQRQHLTPFLRYHSAAAMSSVESRQNARFFNPLTAKMHKSCLVFLLTKPDARFGIHRGDARE